VNLLHVDVTERDIEDGIPGDACNCPIQGAIRRALMLRGHIDADVHFLGTVCLYRPTTGSGHTVVHVPLEACRWMARFDDGLYVEPFRFTLDLDDIASGWQFI